MTQREHDERWPKNPQKAKERRSIQPRRKQSLGRALFSYARAVPCNSPTPVEFVPPTVNVIFIKITKQTLTFYNRQILNPFSCTLSWTFPPPPYSKTQAQTKHISSPIDNGNSTHLRGGNSRILRGWCAGGEKPKRNERIWNVADPLTLPHFTLQDHGISSWLIYQAVPRNHFQFTLAEIGLPFSLIRLSRRKRLLKTNN